ncbi:4Fe-4S binding protein [candidate division WOR-3 bacterium]|nr:4Fe-4S binding protein [candidate division WOR-3 bacterium]
MEIEKKNTSNDVEKYTKRIRITYIAFLISFFATGFMRGVLGNLAEGDLQTFFKFWQFFVFEYYVRTLIVILAGYFTIKRTIALKGEISQFRLISIAGFSASMMIFFVIVPTIWRFMGFGYLFMPFPWTSAPLMVVLNGEVYHSSFTALFGESGVQIAVISYLAFQLLVCGGVVIHGRRWFCSFLCCFAGCHAETFGDVLPFIPHNKKRPKSKAVHPKIVIALKGLQILELILSLSVFLLLLIWVLGGKPFLSIDELIRIEITRVLFLDTYLLNTFWWLIGGRFGCYYCPSGALLGALGRCVGQRIETNLTECIECGLCNDACKMSIDIMSKAKVGKPVITINCTGCGLCVDSCPKGNLKYSTTILRRYRDRHAHLLRNPQS